MSERPKILIVDDRRENLVALREVLRDVDAEVVEACDGNQALTATLLHDFALAILDVRMPGMDGYELADLLRGDPKTAKMPVIFMTATDNDETNVFRGYDTGAVDFIIKPYTPTVLLAKVRVFLDLDRSQKDLAARVFDLTASEERYRTLVATVPDIVYRIDTEGRFTFLNDAIRSLGYAPEELMGRPFAEIVLAEDLEMVSRRHVLPGLVGRKTEAGQAPKLFDERRSGARKTTALEVRLTQKIGVDPTRRAAGAAWPRPVYIAEVNSSGYYARTIDRQPTFLGTVGIIRDITQRKETELELNRHREQLEKMVKARTAELDKRVRELECLYAVSRLVAESAKPIEAVLTDAVRLIPTGFRHPNIACARLSWRGKEFAAANFRETPWRMAADIPAGGDPADSAAVEIHYLWEPAAGEETIFLEEERQLLNNIAGQLGVMFERRHSEAALRDSEEKFRAISELAMDAVVMFDDEGGIAYWSPSATALFGYERAEIVGRDFRGTLLTEPNRSFQEQEDGGIHGKVIETSARHKNGEKLPVEIAISPISIKGKDWASAIIRDISSRKAAETEREKLQAQLTQAQRLESVGRLAGGVAHDYNNMLSVILGFGQMAREKVAKEDPLRADLDEIILAARRSTDITRQLLAFARKQAIAPKVVQLNDAIGGMLKMLRRLIGEDIDLAWLPETGLWPVRIDPSQIDQILANLCVNARDAIKDVGKVTIETANASFDAAYCADHPECSPGEYVRLSVSDNGCGMDRETVDKIFEPFFTTKAMGQGTGLGLATVYGIVKQNNGFINVYSEPGTGSCFRIYLRRDDATETEPSVEEKTIAATRRNNETILLVEDEPAILKMAMIMLQNQGYTVLAAATPGEAMRLAREYNGKIHLLLTDVIMPEMNGRDLADELNALYPKLSHLFMSGYTANAIAHHGVLDKGVHFIQKPFTKEELAVKIRQALGDGEHAGPLPQSAPVTGGE